ncbi:MAG TPA: DUF6632 domain-containing protein [Candidatus Acidoferrum sp.]|nr:DUF6632 domain-containing protein [Candidatus Acidoferrum sp.]
MSRERTLKTVLVVVGLLFVAMAYPLVAMHIGEAEQMMLSVYVTLGIFLLVAARNPAAHRSLIAFAGWSSLAHASVMSVQSVYDAAERVHFLAGVALFAVIGIAILALSPAKSKAAEA